MKRKSIAAILLLVAMVFALVGCNYVGRPVGAGNNATDTGNMLSKLLEQPTKTVIEQSEVQIQEKEEEKPAPAPDNGNDDPTPAPAPDDNPTDDDKQPEDPFDITEDVFQKINDLLKKVADDMVDAKSATGVSDELMKGRTVYVYTPYDISGKDQSMMKSVASKLNMTVVVNNVGKEGAYYSAYMKKVALSDTKADIMYVDQNTWGDIQYYTQPLTSFVNFELGDKLNTFRSSMSQNYSISDTFLKSVQMTFDYYVAAGIGAPYLLAYNKANLVSNGTLAAGAAVAGGDVLSAVTLADPAEMYKDKTWGLRAMQQMLINSTVDKCVGLATVKDSNSNMDWWFGCDNIPGFRINQYTKAADYSYDTTDDYFDYYSASGLSTKTLDAIQNMYWTNTGSNGKFTANFINASETDKALNKLFNNYVGADPVAKYAMLGVEAQQIPQVVEAAKNASWDFVGYPYGTIYEDIRRSCEPNANGDYLINDESDEDVITPATAGWAGGFAVLERCVNPAVALRFAEDYTVAWREDFEGKFTGLFSDKQLARYNDMKANMGVTFYRSMKSHVTDSAEAYVGADEKVSSTALSAMGEFTAAPELFTQLIFDKETPVGSYVPKTAKSWSAFFTPERVDGMCAGYEIARVMFNY